MPVLDKNVYIQVPRTSNISNDLFPIRSKEGDLWQMHVILWFKKALDVKTLIGFFQPEPVFPNYYFELFKLF